MADERKRATVLFADLVGSTALAEAMDDPERTRAALERFYDVVAAEIEVAGGTVEKFAGDAVMAAFGAPEAQEDHAERALHAALAVRRCVDEAFAGRVGLRIGVQSGEVVVGRARESSSFVSGDVVNTAARLEQAAGVGEILVGERTAQAVSGAFEFGTGRSVDAKGKSAGVTCMPLVRALSLMRPRGFAGLERVFVGRGAELEQLMRAYAAVAGDGCAHLVTVVGEAGVGKTTLVRELWQQLDSLVPVPLRRTGRCLPYGRGVTYWPLAEVLREQLGLLESDPAERALERLGDRRVLGLTLGLDVADGAHPLAARDRLQESWTELVEQLSADRPLVLLVEDVHWAEQPLLDLLERLFRDVRAPLLLICTARPEFLQSRPGWGVGPGATAIRLEPLSDPEAAEMVEQLLGQEPPEWVRRLAVGRAEGNPFFAEELLRTLIDQGLLAHGPDGWVAVEPSSPPALPDSVHALVAARIDLLQQDEKAALQAAAVIGRVFWSSPIYELVDSDAPVFRALEDRDFVRRRPGSSLIGEREYAFKHAVIREVAYGSLPKVRRARLHAAFAEWLERTTDGRAEYASLLAHHFAEAVRPDDLDLVWGDETEEPERLRASAMHWLRRAGELAAARYELADAAELLQRALQIAPEDSDLWRRLADVRRLQYDGFGLLEAMERVIELDDDRARQAEAFADLAFENAIRRGMWIRQPPTLDVERWITRAVELSQPESATRAKALAALATWQPRTHVDEAREASELADRLGTPELRSYAYGARACAALENYRFKEADVWIERRLELAREIDDPDHLVDVYENAIADFASHARFPEAQQLLLHHIENAERLSPHHRVHSTAITADLDELTASWEAITSQTAHAQEVIAANAETPCIRHARTLLICALASAHLEDNERAHQLEQEATKWEMEDFGAWIAEPRLRLALLRNDLDTVAMVMAGHADASFRADLGPAPLAAFIDAFAALGERKRVEELAPQLCDSPYLEPFALRALGVVRHDDSLFEKAALRFTALGLHRHASETHALRDTA